MSDKNRVSWNECSAQYSEFNHSELFMSRIAANPRTAFHNTTWTVIQKYMPELRGKRICVPSSGDNHAVFAFAILGAEVTS